MGSSVTLKEYVEASNLSYEGFAALIPCSSTYPWMIAHGKAKPGWRMACRIEAVTGGSVPRSNWYPETQLEHIENMEDMNITDMMKGVKK